MTEKQKEREKRVAAIIKYLWFLALIAFVCDIVYTMVGM